MVPHNLYEHQDNLLLYVCEFACTWVQPSFEVNIAWIIILKNVQTMQKNVIVGTFLIFTFINNYLIYRWCRRFSTWCCHHFISGQCPNSKSSTEYDFDSLDHKNEESIYYDIFPIFLNFFITIVQYGHGLRLNTYRHTDVHNREVQNNGYIQSLILLYA